MAGSRGGGFSGGNRGGSFGGSRGGGFGGGNRGGFGGPRPGGFGGPHHHPPHHHHHHHHGPHFGWGWGWGPRRYYGGGGGCLGALMAPIIIGIFLLFLLIYMLLPAENTSNFGKEYDETVFQSALEQKYAEYFAPGATHEDNILLYYLVEEEGEQIYCIAKVGDNVHKDIYYIFGGNETPLGNAVFKNVEAYYAYSLDTNLAAVINDMEEEIVGMQLSSSFKKDTTRPASPSESKFVDLTGDGLPVMTADTVNTALASFTEKTGIRTVLCVDYIDNVFGSSGGNGGATALLVIAIGVLVAAVAFTSYSNRKNRKKKEDI